MWKLMKYEFRKQLLSKTIVFGATAVLELIFFLGLLMNSEDLEGIGAGFQIFCGVIGLLYFSFECIITYSNDLRTKQSYMLFLTPRSMYQIVGAKLITTVLQIVGAAVICSLTTLMNIVLFCAKSGSFQELVNFVEVFLQELTGSEVRMSDVLMALLMVTASWLVFLMVAMFSITLSSTLFANKRWKWVVSVLIFFTLNVIVNKVVNSILTVSFEGDSMKIAPVEAVGCLLIYFGVMILDFIGTAFLLEKKVSV